jgi:hypothetical protein
LDSLFTTDPFALRSWQFTFFPIATKQTNPSSNLQQPCTTT